MAVTAIDILNTFFPSAATDFVAVFDQDFNQVFRNARAIKATIKPQSKSMEHPLENGAIITDHRILMPIEIDLSLILSSEDYQNVYNEIVNFYTNATLLIVQTRSGIYSNQLISAIPNEEDPAMYNALSVALSLKEVLFVTAQYGIVPKFPSNTNTVDRGVQQGTMPVQGSTLLTKVESGFQSRPFA